MTNQVANFKVLEVTGTTRDEALAKAPFYMQGEATQKYRMFKEKKAKAGEAITADVEKQFMLDYLADKTKYAPGSGFWITVESAVKNTRECPVKTTDVKNEKGKRKYVTTYQIVDATTGKVLAETSETKAKAKEIAKSLYTDKGFTGNIICTYTKQVVEGEPIAFKMEYAPSKASRIGVYKVFGIEA